MARILVWCLALVVMNSALARASVLEPVPASARIRIVGPSPISGSGAVDLHDLPTGESTLVASAPGFTAARTRLLLDDEGRIEFRSWSGPSAFLQPPGFAHLRRDEPRGWLHLGAWAGSGLALLVSQQDLEDARERLQRARGERELASSAPEERIAALELGAARDEEFDRANVRDLWAAYLAAAWIGAGLEAWWMTPGPDIGTTGGGDPIIALRESSGWKTALGSLLVPGAGQRAVGQDRRGNLFGTAVLLGAAAAIVTQDLFLDARRERTHAARVLALATEPDDIAAARSALDAARSDEDRMSSIRYATLGAAIALHAWNVIDAFAVGHRSPDANAVRGPRLTPTSDGARLSWTWDFSVR